MTAVGGSIESVSLRGREFPVAGDAESQRKTGGFENEVMQNGNGTARIIKTRTSWMLDGVAIEIDDSRGDHEYIQELSDDNDFFPTTITYASGITYAGQGQLTGDVQTSSQSATMPITLMGTGELTPQ